MRVAAPLAMPASLHFQPQHLEALRWFIYVILAWRPAWLLEAAAKRYDAIFYFFVGKASDAAAGVTHAASPMDTTTAR